MRYALATALIALTALTGQALTGQALTGQALTGQALIGQVLIGQAAAQSPSADPPPMKAEDTPQTTPQTPPSQRPPREMQQQAGPERQVQQPEPQPPAPQQGVQQQGAPPQPPASAQRPESPTGVPLGSAQQQRDGHEATQTRSGIGGKQEPGATTPMRHEGPVLVDGKLNVPGAAADSQTVPAKFSERNAALDKRPIMALPLALSEDQKRKLAAAIRSADVPNAQIDPKLTEELPVTVQLHEMPPPANDMGVGNYKYVRLSDRILLVTPANRIVVAEIKG